VISTVSALIGGSAAYAVAFAVASLPMILFWRRSKKLIRAVGPDLDARLGVDDETQDFDEAVAESGAVPVLSARNIDFAYGSVQVLFDVSMRVNEGEMVALLGPNGVGKTTLLRVLSGLESPQAGVVRLAGDNVTDVNASKRVALGLSQIVGGNAVFGSMTVYENLMMYGFSLGRDRASIKEGIDEAFQVFPKIADRRNQLGSTLSGGEQQMLGLSKALITKPKILVVDEFSLGLAPIVVGELLEMVRQLNARGTAILVVEQSVNVALNLVDRCYFMEKGEIVYEGNAKDLLAQPELVQALSLGGHTSAADSDPVTLDKSGSPA
jgi:ABC-type branched-subunit amino acid transport system ATPase component